MIGYGLSFLKKHSLVGDDILYLIVSIDTEEDMPNWRPEKVKTSKNILCLPKLQKLFRKYSVVPTYLVDQPVLEDELSLKLIRQLATDGGCEIGAHVHSWNTPPLTVAEENGAATYLNMQQEDLQREKLFNFTKLFKKTLGFSPKSYRAGRYGFDRSSAKILTELGYKVDSSIAPIMDFSGDGGPDYRKYTLKPFWIQGLGGDDLLELPITISLVHKFPQYFEKIYFKIPDWSRIKGVFHRLRLARLLWLRPTTYTDREMKQLADHVLDCLDVPVLNIMFHSSEVCAGASPYNTTEQDVDDFLQRLDWILLYLVGSRNLKSVSMTEFAELCDHDKGQDIFGEKLHSLEM